MTKPFGASAAQDDSPSPDDHPRVRRHSDDWQLGVAPTTGDLAFDDTVDLDFAQPNNLQTTQIAQPEPTVSPGGTYLAATLRTSNRISLEDAVTAPFAKAIAPASPDQNVTAPIARRTGRFVSNTLSAASADEPQTARIGTDVARTARIVAPAASINDETVQLLRRPGQSSTLSSVDAMTTEIARLTSQIGAATAPADMQTAPMSRQSLATRTDSDTGGDNYAALSTETRAEIERLQELVKQDSSNSDALFELSVLLHRAGLRNNAREVLTKLVALYEQRGQHQQAQRIKGMLSAPKTGPIYTEALAPSEPTSAATIRLNSQTATLRGGTAVLKGSTSAIGRARELGRAKAVVVVHAFPPESMIFTIPLPGEETLPAEAREILHQSGEELQNNHLLAAIDSCVQIIALAPDYMPVHLRLAEIYTRQRQVRRARMQADALIRLAGTESQHDDLWMVYRVLLHANGGDTPSLKRLVELLIDAGRTEQASFYASRLIQILDAEGLTDEALAFSIRLCDLIPGDTRAALENSILCVKGGNRGGALDRWEFAVSVGADAIVARSSIAALTTTINEDDHWKILSDVIPVIRERHDLTIIDAYARTAAALPDSITLEAGHGLMLIANNDMTGCDLLVHAAGSRNGAPIARASAAVALAWTLGANGTVDEYVAAVRTALNLLKDEQVANHPAWEGLVGRIPRIEDLSLELGEALLTRGDAAGAAEVLKEAHTRSRNHGPICERLAEAYFKIGQLGSALTVLDELAVHFRASGQLDAMAGVLRQMSQLAPNNIKVKSRLIDAYLQRGFVAEARAEMIQRADLEERSGLIKDALASLQKAAELSWTIGLADETFALYNRVIEMAPDDIGNRSSLVNYLLQLGRLSDAAGHQRAVVDIAIRTDNKHEAVAALHQVIGLTPDDTSAYYQLAELLGAMGEYHQAERVYRRLVMMNPADAIAQAKATSMASLSETRER